MTLTILNTLVVVLVAASAVGTIVTQEPVGRDVKGDRARSQENLHRIGLAMHNFYEKHNHFPVAAIYGKNNQPLLSWRVSILPYLGEEKLYSEFHLDEAWDSAHNKKLLARMPNVYAPPGIKTKEPNSTFYQVFVGDGGIFDGQRKVTIRDITDGTSCTILAVEAAEAVPWTKPQDLPLDSRKPVPSLGGIFQEGFHFLAADASVHSAKKNFDQKKMHAAVRRASGEIKDLNDLEP
jgi:hypothetical protein